MLRILIIECFSFELALVVFRLSRIRLTVIIFMISREVCVMLFLSMARNMTKTSLWIASIANIGEFQIIVDNSCHPKLNIVPEDGAERDRIRNMLQQRWPIEFEINFVEYKEPEKIGWRKKFGHVINQRDSINE